MKESRVMVSLKVFDLHLPDLEEGKPQAGACQIKDMNLFTKRIFHEVMGVEQVELTDFGNYSINVIDDGFTSEDTICALIKKIADEVGYNQKTRKPVSPAIRIENKYNG